MKLKTLVQMMAILPVIALPATTALHASDLSIYKPNSGGKTSILLMLDTSGSMGISSLVLPSNNKYGSPGDVESSLCEKDSVDENFYNSDNTHKFYEWKYNAKPEGSTKTTFPRTVTINGETITYYLRGCSAPNSKTPYIDANGNLVESATGKFDRLSRMKHAMIQLLSDQSIENNVRIGLAHFSSKTNVKIDGTGTNSSLVDGHSAKILVPVAELSLAQREKLIRELAGVRSIDTKTDEDGNEIKNNKGQNSLRLSTTDSPGLFKASSGTPTAHAYAEAGAYMMGTTTGSFNPPSNIDVLYDGYAVIQKNNSTDQVYYVCVDLKEGRTGTPFRNSTTKSMLCDNEWNKGDTQWWDSGKKRMASKTKIFKPDGLGGWIPVTAEQLQEYLNSLPDKPNNYGNMNSLWETHEKLPNGWRYGGWMKVPEEPMDIEPIGGVVWPNKGSNNLVSYRSSPFSLIWGDVTGRTITYNTCPTGYSISSIAGLCQKTLAQAVTRDATAREKEEGACLTSVVGEDPIRNVYVDTSSSDTSDAFRNNKENTTYNNEKCKQTRQFVARPWSEATKTIKGPVDNMVGGFVHSVAESKNGDKYKAGGVAKQCNGNGIYFLTDGAPNSTKDTMAQTIMNLTLVDSAYKFNSKPTDGLLSPSLPASVFPGETGGWEYIGAYAKKLRTAENPAKMSIKTAVVGFGSSFSGITKNADGTYNCESIKNINADAYNACKWGSDEYGEGGFYYAENVEDIKQSILDFVDQVQVPFTATSLGSISVPRDPLDQTQVLTEGFFPMITPVDDSEAANDQKNHTWAGNLKKYKIIDGTLKSVTDQPIYELDTTTNQQVINRAAKDLWSIAASTDDHSLATSGGALNKIPVPSLQNVIGDPSKNDSERRVFILDGTTLKRVAKDNLATDFSPTNGGLLQSLTYDASKPTDANSITVAQRYALLNYLGYSAPTGTSLTTANLASYTVPQDPYRYLGGVVHSTPLVATKSATINAADNSIVSRDEYVVYGSMDGGLHIVDAETGVEKSVFVPKEILKNQLDTLQSSNPKGTGLAYGVDAPWALDVQYKIKNTTTGTTTTTAYEADRLNVYGGLRMGGSALYGLDIKKPESPALLFHITRSTSGFDRLAQIWSKPTIAYMRVKGVRTRVLIFGGGYDETVYERENITEPTSQTLGNALYIVNADNGNLIWSTSSSHTSTSNTVTAHSDVKYSVVGQPAIRDYDSDGLADMIYFADLGGQIFRVDLNNLAQMSTTADRNIAVRVSRIANLRENGFVPRFYERVTTGIFGQGSERHVFVSVGSGNRSFPLESTVTENKIYGILDYDAAKNGIESATYNGGFKPEATVDNIINRGVLGKTNTSVDGVTANAAGVTDTHKSALLSNATGATAKRGWSFSLRSVGDTTTAKYAKSFEEAQLVVGDLYVNLYDPKATLGASAADDCGGGVQGLSTVHRVCAPYGDCAAYVTTDYQGIIGPTLGGLTNPARTTRLIGPLAPQGEKCIGRCETIDANDVESLKQYSQSRKIRPTRWFEW